MTDELNGGASAPSEPSTIAPETQANYQQPAEAQLPDPKPANAAKDEGQEPKKAPTAREALKRAAEKVAKAQASQEPLDKPGGAAKTEGAGDKPAQTKPADAARTTEKPAEAAQSKSDAPARFSADAKAAWATAPEPVKAEVHRAIRELEQGHEKYRADAEAFGQIKDFDDLAKKNGTTIRDAMTRYTVLEKTLLTNPMQGIEAVCEYAGVSLRELAALVMGQTPDKAQSQNDATIRALRQEIAGLKDQIGGVTTSMQQQHQSKIAASVDEFAKNNPRFEELADDIAFFIESGKTKDLAEAYKMADRLNPAPSAAAPAAPAANTAHLEAQTLKGSKSVSGAPSLGSDPSTRKRSTSIRESLARAVAQAG
jgi:hypothetical protein